jgi:hypothetical protein
MALFAHETGVSGCCRKAKILEFANKKQLKLSVFCSAAQRKIEAANK